MFYDSRYQCHVVYNRCGYCHACYRSRRIGMFTDLIESKS